MSDQFDSLVQTLRTIPGLGWFTVETPFGSYLNGPGCTGEGKILRLRTLEELQATWCITKACWQHAEDDMNANAIACKRFHGHAEEQHLADRHADRHEYHAKQYGIWENQAIAIQAEMQWRLDNPTYDPNDPFRDE